ncbi:MAG: NYN domain-containing protein [Microcystaceae cyanobacterium]
MNLTQLSVFEKPDIESANTLRSCHQNNSDKKLNQRIAIFIDGANLFYAAMHLNIEIDYTKLLGYLTKERQLLRAYFYTGVDYTNEKQQGFLLWMSRNGYRVVSKELIALPNGSKKADLDVEIAIDMMTLARYCNTLVLFSGDGDLAYAVDNITYRGVKVEVVGLSSMTSESLIRVADSYTDLELIKQDIQKKNLGWVERSKIQRKV